MAVSTIKKRMEVQKLVVDTTTDVMGDIALYSLSHASNLIIGADPDRLLYINLTAKPSERIWQIAL